MVKRVINPRIRSPELKSKTPFRLRTTAFMAKDRSKPVENPLHELTSILSAHTTRKEQSKAILQAFNLISRTTDPTTRLNMAGLLRRFSSIDPVYSREYQRVIEPLLVKDLLSFPNGHALEIVQTLVNSNQVNRSFQNPKPDQLVQYYQKVLFEKNPSLPMMIAVLHSIRLSVDPTRVPVKRLGVLQSRVIGLVKDPEQLDDVRKEGVCFLENFQSTLSKKALENVSQKLRREYVSLFDRKAVLISQAEFEFNNRHASYTTQERDFLGMIRIIDNMIREKTHPSMVAKKKTRPKMIALPLRFKKRIVLGRTLGRLKKRK